ncbi:hypothetical protein KGA66_17205 [Actinocrinis puniceicyclus]|uniref:Uncharacterized protein n=1 Tax=Actinocrinis puniceicyclus TaxID=977794 RepID=A0A8J7WRC7_9ACTN|nr:hypothetical protein [Actinocrinis puniceicyclus]MBS2964799.1 hypothetical protein [Actinocrinis puniceicyclus]
MAEDLIPAVHDTEKALGNAFHSVADGADGVAGRTEAVEAEATGRLSSVGNRETAAASGSAQASVTGVGGEAQAALRTRISSALAPREAAAGGALGSGLERWPASGPMRPGQEAGVRAALERMKFPPNDRQKIFDAPKSKKSPMGADAAELIARGHLEGADEYREVLSQFKMADARPAAMMSLRHADDLHRLGHRNLLFEMKEQPGQSHFDIDVGTRAVDHSLAAGYQLKDVQRVAGLDSASRKAIAQLVNAPSGLRVALMDVHEPSTALDDATRQLLSSRAAAKNITLHLRFADGRDLTFPPGAAVYPDH